MAYDHKKYMRRYNKTHKDEAKAKALEFRKNNLAREFIRRKANLCKQQGLRFEINENDILPLPTHCPVLGMKLRYFGPMDESTATIDRVDPDGGYVAGNVRVISMRANRIKSDASIAELELVIAYMKGISLF